VDKKSKIFFLVFFLLIVGAVGATFYRIMIKKDYIVSAETDCDPYTENCFIWECDPASTVEGEACVGDPETDTWYYKIIKRNAGRIPLCDPNDENCTALVCDENEPECSETLCDETTKVEKEAECVDPVQYSAENPVEEEAVECEEGDEECLAAEEAAAECEEGDEECLAAQEAAVECEEDDEECLAAAEAAVDLSADEAGCEEGGAECLSAQDAAAEDAAASEETTGEEAIGEEKPVDEAAPETAPVK